MSELDTSNSPVKDFSSNENDLKSTHLFITVGKGLEEISQSEILEKTSKFNTKIRDILTGKVFFEANTSKMMDLLDSLSTLKTVERVFAVVGVLKTPKMWNTSSSNTYKQTVDFEKNLKQQICNLPNWDSAKNIWKYRIKESSCILDSEERPIKKLKVDGQQTTSSPNPPDLQPPTQTNEYDIRFRISCKSSKSLRDVNPQVRKFVALFLTQQSLGKFLGIAIRNKFGWQVDLKHYNMEIYVHISDPNTIVGIPLFQGKNLADRDYIKHTRMRSSLAYAMCRVANIKPYQTVCDPMCGAGITLIEAAKNFPSLHLIGCDIEQGTLRLCHENLEYANITNADILQCDIKSKKCIVILILPALPLKTASVDCIVCDIPFGQKYGSYETMKILYPIILSQMARVLKPSQTAVILTSQVLLLEWNLKRMSDVWEDWTKTFVKLGYTKAYIYVLHRTSRAPKPPLCNENQV